MASNLSWNRDNIQASQHSSVRDSKPSMAQTTNSTSMAQYQSEQEDRLKSSSRPYETEEHKSIRHSVSRMPASINSKTRPRYSRKYSTPPSRPLSPSGFPQILDSDMKIPELDLQYTHHHVLQVDSAPQDPDLWDDPDTDYFSTIEGGPITRHGHQRAKSRAQSKHVVSKNMQQQLSSDIARDSGLTQISEDAEAEFRLPPTPGAWGG